MTSKYLKQPVRDVTLKQDCGVAVLDGGRFLGGVGVGFLTTM